MFRIDWSEESRMAKLFLVVISYFLAAGIGLAAGISFTLDVVETGATSCPPQSINRNFDR